MANTTISPNMNLVVPTPGVETGPQYAYDINQDLNIIDAHTHAPGSGVQIQPNGINISTDLPFNNNNAVTLRSSRYTSQAAALALATDLGCISNINGNLYWNNNGGTPVQITNGSSLAGAAGTITGLPSGTAGVAYASGVYVFQSATATSATLDSGSVIIRNATASSYGMTVSAPSALASNTNCVLPLPPVSATSFLQMDSVGNITASIAVNGALTSTNLSASAGIVGSQLANNTLSDTQISLQGISAASILNGTLTTTQISSSAGITSGQLASPVYGSGTTTGASYTSGTNTAITISNAHTLIATRPWLWSLFGASSGAGFITIPAGWKVTIEIQSHLTVLAYHTLDNTTGSSALVIPLSAFNGWTSGVAPGANNILFIVVINTAGSGSVTMGAATMQVTQV